MRYQIAGLFAAFAVGVSVGVTSAWLYGRRHVDIPIARSEWNDDTKVSDDTEFSHALEFIRRPCVATLMSKSRSMDGVCYFLNREMAMKIDGRYKVFEAMIFGPNYKGPYLSFWSDEKEHSFRGIPYFSVALGTDVCPRSLARHVIGADEVMVVRYLAKINSTFEGSFFLEDQTLLGYVILETSEAMQLLSEPRSEDTIDVKQPGGRPAGNGLDDFEERATGVPRGE